jgi:Winged helix-turn-helix DNA-binding
VPNKSQTDGTGPPFGFLTSHSQVLLSIAADPETTMRRVAARVGLSERRVQEIVAQLADAGYLTVAPAGRRKRYAVNREAALRGPLVGGRTAGELVDWVWGGSPPG